MAIHLMVDGRRICNVYTQVTRKDMTSEQGDYFLELFGDALEQQLVQTIRRFVAEKFNASPSEKL